MNNDLFNYLLLSNRRFSGIYWISWVAIILMSSAMLICYFTPMWLLIPAVMGVGAYEYKKLSSPNLPLSTNLSLTIQSTFLDICLFILYILLLCAIVGAVAFLGYIAYLAYGSLTTPNPYFTS